MSKQPHNPGDDVANDETLSDLLREVGARDLPTQDVMGEVRQAVHAEWRALVEERRRRNRKLVYGLAASIAVAVLAVAFSVRFTSAPPVQVASVTRIDGALQVDHGGNGEWRPVTVGEHLSTGDVLRTDDGTRAALGFGEGVSVRVDVGSLVRLAAQSRIVLDHGGIYVDAAPQVPAPQPLVIETAYGSVHHLGTQYQVRTARDGIEVSVREGRVEIVSAGGTHSGVAGEQLVIPREGAVSRMTISPHDPDWQWATRVAPAFDIDRQPLASFLGWIARETGKQIVYATPETQIRAEQLILRGSVNDLAPDQALAAVLATTPLKYSETPEAIQVQP